MRPPLAAPAPLTAEALLTDLYSPPEPLAEFVVRELAGRPPREGDVLCVTSKIVSLAEGEVMVIPTGKTKLDVVRAEADRWLGEAAYGTALTIKHGLLIPSAGIDESNSSVDGQLILYPRDPYASAHALWVALRARFGLRDLGVILTDSHTTPLRRGVTGISLAHAGFRGVRSLIGEPDLHGRKLKMTEIDLVDAIATTAVLLMGEGAERRPLARVRAPGVEFDEATTAEIRRAEIVIDPDLDIYAPMLGERP